MPADWPALIDAWRASYHPSMDRVRKGELPWTKLDDLHRASLDKLVAEFGIKGLTEQDLVHINLGWHRLNGWPDSVPGLTRLKTRFVIGPLSNGNVSLLTYMAKHAGLPWDMVFGSDLFGHFKPDPETYLGVAKLMDLAPDQVMMAAAHNGDLGNARKCGLHDGVLRRGRMSMGRIRSAITRPSRTGISWRRTLRIWRRNWGFEASPYFLGRELSSPPERETACERSVQCNPAQL